VRIVLLSCDSCAIIMGLVCYYGDIIVWLLCD